MKAQAGETKKLLSYLYGGFYEEAEFRALIGVSADELAHMIATRIAPNPSYTLTNTASLRSFVSTTTLAEDYQFYPRGYVDWVQALRTEGIKVEAAAQDYFGARSNKAQDVFFASQMGSEMIGTLPELALIFGAQKLRETWGYFLEGVFGVCTRTGTPEDIFYKQVGVQFVDLFRQKMKPQNIPPEQLRLLDQVVRFLDKVESDFAPHELQETSRQRCIIDVRKNYGLEALS